MRIPVAVSLALACAACSSTPDALPPVDSLRGVDVAAKGAIGFRGLADVPRGGTPVAVDSLEKAATIRIWKAARQEVEGLLTTGMPGVAGRVVDAESATRAATLLDGVTPADRRAIVQLGLDRISKGYIETTRQVTHVAGWNMSAIESATAMDPVIEVETLGARVTVDAVSVAGSSAWSVGVKIEFAETPREFVDIEVPTTVEDHAVTVELPCIARLDLETRADLESGQAILIAAPDLEDPAGAVAVLITLQVAAPAR